jgi:hypothetical protein
MVSYLVNVKASSGEAVQGAPPPPPVPQKVLDYAAALALAVPLNIEPTTNRPYDRLLLHAIANAKAVYAATPADITMDWLLPTRAEHEIGGNPTVWSDNPKALVYKGFVDVGTGTPQVCFIGLSY